MMKLQLVDRIYDPETQQTTQIEPELKHVVVRQKAAREATYALQMVTEDGGTAVRAAIPGFHVAGKTGTAEKFLDGTYKSGKYVASFIGFVPAENPELVLLVVADEPSKSYHSGGMVCAPSFSRIGEKTLKYLNIPPTIPEETGFARNW